MDFKAACCILSVLTLFDTFMSAEAAENCTNEKIASDIEIKKHCYKGYLPCVLRSLKKKHPKLYNEPGLRQPKVKNYTLSSFCKIDDDDVNHSGLNIQWKLPDNSGAENIEGFEIRISGYATSFQCDIIELREKITKDKINNIFNMTVYPVTRGRKYSVNVITLPRTNDSYMDVEEISTTKCDRGISSDTWKPKSYNYTYSRNILTFKFEKPPAKFKLKVFAVAVISISLGTVHEETFNSTEMVFYNVKPGKYKIMVEPLDEYRHDKARCLCKNDEDECSSACLMTDWTLELKDTSTGKIRHDWVYICIGILLGLLILSVIFVLVVKKYSDFFFKSSTFCIGTSGSDEQIILCIDASSSSEMTSSLRELVTENFKHTLKFHHVTYNADEFTNCAHLVEVLEPDDRNRKLCLPSVLFCHRDYRSVDQTVGKKVIVCLMVNRFGDKKSSDLYLKIKNELNNVASTYRDFIVIYSSKGGNISEEKSFNISNKESLVSGIKNIFEDKPVSIPIVNHSTKCTTANKCSKTFDNNYVKSVKPSNKDILAASSPPENEFELYEYASSPESSYPLLHTLEESRPRYYSDDSGRGPSIKDGEGFWDNLNFYTPGNGVQFSLGVIPETQLWSCPPKFNAGNITFYPPSTISEDPDLTSLDSIMDEMMALNERNDEDYMRLVI